MVWWVIIFLMFLLIKFFKINVGIVWSWNGILNLFGIFFCYVGEKWILIYKLDGC